MIVSKNHSHPCWRYKEIRDLTIVDKYVPDLCQFIELVWDSKQNTLVVVPEGMDREFANQLTSKIKAFKELILRTGGTVDIKQVAEIRGSRFNNGKPRLDLIDWEAMEGLAAVLAFGANKYAAYNWKKGLPITEQVASLLRHLSAFMRGEDIDPETGLPHVDHLQCNTMFLSWTFKNRPDMDDRWKPPADSKSS